MLGEAAIGNKQKEVDNIAARLGVERYIGTERMAPVEAIVGEWAVQAENQDLMTQESLWLDAKDEIERIMTDMSLSHNSAHDIFLLGAAQSGAMPFDDVRSSFVDAWGKMLSIHQESLATLTDHDLRTIDRSQSKALSQIPNYGTIQDKQRAIETAKAAIQELEEILKQVTSRTEGARMKGEIASRETSRAMIIAEAKSGKRRSLIPKGDYEEIMNLVGKTGDSLFSQQLSTVQEFGHSPEIILTEMDRTLAKAVEVLERESDTTTLAGGFRGVTDPRQHRISALGATVKSNNGDGIHLSRTNNPEYRGNASHGASTTNIPGMSMFDSRGGVDPAKHRVTSSEKQLSSPYTNTTAFVKKHAAKNEGLYRDGYGGVVSNYAHQNPVMSGLVTMFAIGGTVWLASSMYATSKNSKKQSKLLQSGVSFS